MEIKTVDIQFLSKNLTKEILDEIGEINCEPICHPQTFDPTNLDNLNNELTAIIFNLEIKNNNIDHVANKICDKSIDFLKNKICGCVDKKIITNDFQEKLYAAINEMITINVEGEK